VKAQGSQPDEAHRLWLIQVAMRSAVSAGVSWLVS
jgi:hypothetical protein